MGLPDEVHPPPKPAVAASSYRRTHEESASGLPLRTVAFAGDASAGVVEPGNGWDRLGLVGDMHVAVDQQQLCYPLNAAS